MQTESYTIKTNYVWVLMTDGKPRLAFNSEERAREYQAKDIWNGTIFRVFNGVEQVPSVKKGFSHINGKLFCDNCHEQTVHHTKEGQTNGKTYCNRCGNMTEYTENYNEGKEYQ